MSQISNQYQYKPAVCADFHTSPLLQAISQAETGIRCSNCSYFGNSGCTIHPRDTHTNITGWMI